MSTSNIKGSYRTISILTITMIFLTVFAFMPMTDIGKSYAAGETAKVTASLLNVRSGAGTGYSKIGTLKKGKTFTVTGTAKDKSGVKWYKFKYSSKKNGYVSSKYVDIKAPTVTSVSNLKGTVNTKSDPLTVRSGAGSSYKKLGTLAKGKTFTITGKAKDSSGVWWYRFTYSGKNGFVSSKYVKTKSTAISSSSSSTSNGSSSSSGTSSTGSSETGINLMGTVNTANDPLTVRSGPGSSYSSIGTLKKG
ncbi:MAG: SH3 domain-containing protein, partial [Firmicutes bacterium]|nr:SH3 domain-containing protein [Bacillota bacterium]